MGYIAKGKVLTNEYMRKAFGHIPSQLVEDLGAQVNKLTINRDVFAGRVALLQERGLIINTIDFNISRDLMLEWVTKKFIQNLSIEVT